MENIQKSRNFWNWLQKQYLINFFLKKETKWDSLHARLNSHYKISSYKKKEQKKIKAYRKSLHKEPTVKRCLLILDLNPLRSYVKAKHSIGREFQSQAVQGKKLLTSDILVTSRNGHRKLMQSIRITSRPPSRKRTWNQLSQSWRTSTKVIPIEKN